MMVKDSKWNDENTQQLINMHNEKILSTVEMSKRLGVSKNAIVGKIHRLRLKNLVKPLNSSENEHDLELEAQKNIKYGEYKLSEIATFGMCVWPEGDEDFLFCGKEVVTNESYCAEHLRLVYLESRRVVKLRSNLYTRADMEEAEENEGSTS